MSFIIWGSTLELFTVNLVDNYGYLQGREHGLRVCDEENFLNQLIYKSIKPYTYWSNHPEDPSNFGAIFNLEFSNDGNLLVAACEKKSILLFDPITTKQIHAIGNAHTDNVNCIKFLDNRMFATCSDDTTVALWDTRNLKNKIRSLQGHSNWVKNIEYSQKDGLLVTSGFDGSIFTWDVNSYTEQGFIYQKVFHTSGLMRCRLTPDASKLVVCTTGGYIIIIHDLDLTTLAKDLSGFKPNIYRLMQLGDQFIPYAAKFDHIFSKSQKKNRVEFISDFPKKNDAEVVCALQIHPKGWCCLSRNYSYAEGSEWSCVHDIQQRKFDLNANDETDKNSTVTGFGKKRKHSASDNDNDHNNDNNNDNDNERTEFESSDSTSSDDELIFTTMPIHPSYRRSSQSSSSTSSNFENNSLNRSNETSNNNNNRARSEAYVPDIWAAEVTVHDRNCRTLRASTGNHTASANNYAQVYAISSGITNNGTIPLSRSTAEENLDAILGIDETQTNMSHRNGIQDSRLRRIRSPITLSSYVSLNKRKINKNHNRLMYYIEEPNKGKGFIKEPCFSADGRIICSPYGSGIRLLSFSQDCSDVLDYNGQSQPLKEINQIKCHSDIVVSTKFSPKYPLLVTGCLAGKISWHQSDF